MINRPEYINQLTERSNPRFNQEATNKIYLVLLGNRRTLETYRDEPSMRPFVITENDKISINDTLTELIKVIVLISPVVRIPPREPRGGKKTRKNKRSSRRRKSRSSNKKKKTNRRK